MDDEEDLQLDNIGEEGRMSDVEARRIWQRLYRALQVSSTSSQKSFRKQVYAWVCLNSTSSRADLASTILVEGKRVSMRVLFNDEVVPQAKMRRFFRAPHISREMEELARHPQMETTLRRHAQEKGVDPMYYIVVVDVSDKFKLTSAERSELSRYKAAVLSHTASFEKPQVSRAVNDGYSAAGGAPAPSAFGAESSRS